MGNYPLLPHVNVTTFKTPPSLVSMLQISLEGKQYKTGRYGWRDLWGKKNLQPKETRFIHLLD